MEFREWPLLIFTILMQTAIGAFVILWVSQLLARRQVSEAEAEPFSALGFLIVILITGAGLLASFAHLGNPKNAPYVFMGIGTSWLSREVALSVVFAGGAVVYTFLQWRRQGGPVLRDIIGAVTSTVGLILVYAQARAYMVVSVPVWDNFGTPITFFAATIILGALCASALLALDAQKARKSDPDCTGSRCQLLQRMLRWVSLVGVTALGALLVAIVLQLAYFAAAGIPGSELLYDSFGILLAVRVVLAIVGAGVFGLLLYRAAASPGRAGAIAGYAVTAFVIALAAEVIGRYLFYATFSRIGL